MVRVVVCRTPGFAGDAQDARKRARAATPRGKKKLWDHNYNNHTIYHASHEFADRGYNYTLLVWQGSDVDFLLFKLRETTSLVKTFIDIPATNSVWKILARIASVRDQHVDDLRKNIIDRTEFLRRHDIEARRMGRLMWNALKPIHHLL